MRLLRTGSSRKVEYPFRNCPRERRKWGQFSRGVVGGEEGDLRRKSARRGEGVQLSDRRARQLSALQQERGDDKELAWFAVGNRRGNAK